MKGLRYFHNWEGTETGGFKRFWVFILILCLLQGLYAVFFIYRTSFVIEGQRYFCLFDDAMISMRYGANWASGDGFVWNLGERVEGYTTFAWTAIMGLVHLLPLTPSYCCLAIQMLGIITLWLCIIGTVLLAKECGLSPAAAACAAILTGTFYNLLFFTLFGMETGLLTAWITLSLAGTVRCLKQGEGHIWPIFLLVAAVLIRPDVILITLFALGLLLYRCKAGRLRLVAGSLTGAAIVLIHLLWRRHFYGQWLPNTYYLKLTGWPFVERLSSGFRQTILTITFLGVPILLSFLAFIKFKIWHFLLLGCFVICLTYQFFIGGDAWPLSRFVLPASTALFVLAAHGMESVSQYLFPKSIMSRKLTLAVLTFVSILVVNIVHWDHIALITRPQTTNDNWINLRYVYAIRKTVSPQATVAVTWGGVFPYFSQSKCCDILGKCDSYISYLPAHVTVRRAGHNKYDLRYTIEKHKPDIILHLLMGPLDRAITKNYWPVIVETKSGPMGFCVRKDYKNVKDVKYCSWRRLSECLDYLEEQGEEFQTIRHK